MRLDDLRKLATGSVLFTLDRVITPRLIKILYLLGLAAIAVWAVRHFFGTFRAGFGSGLWGLLEIAVFGLLAFVALRIACEAVMVYFRAHPDTAETAPRAGSRSLLDDVRDAIEELADEEEEPDDPLGAPGTHHRADPQQSVAPQTSGTGAPQPGAAQPPPASSSDLPVASNPGIVADTATEYDVPEQLDEADDRARRPSTEPGASHN